jgi:heme-degrading monooxygenase HmoA
MIMQFVRFRSGLSEDDVLKLMEARAPQYRELPGLLQKYYVRDNRNGGFGGIYIWKSEEALQEFRQSELARSIPEVFQVAGQPDVEQFDVLVVLRPER